MLKQYQALKQQAQIYSKLTGKKCYIHHNESNQEQTYKLPNEKRYSQGKYQNGLGKKNSEESHQRQRKKTINITKNKDQIFFNALRKGIKISFQEKSPSLQKTNQRKETKKTSVKKYQNSVQKTLEASPKKEIITLEPIEHPTPFNTNKSQIITLQNKRKKDNYLSLNKIMATKQTNKKLELLDVKGRELLGKSKKQRFILQRKNREEMILQGQIKSYHDKTKSILQEMKAKYHFKFKNQDKSKAKSKKEKSTLQNDHFTDTFTYINNEAIKFDKLKSQIAQIDRKYKKNNQELFLLQQAINNNEFNSAIKQVQQAAMQKITEQQNEEQSEKDYLQQQQNIIEKLKASLLRIKQSKQNGSIQKNQNIKVNQRLKDLLFV